MLRLQYAALVLLAGMGLILPGWWFLALPMFGYTLYYAYVVIKLYYHVWDMGSLNAFYSYVHSQPCCGVDHPRLSTSESGLEVIIDYVTLLLPTCAMFVWLDQTLWAIAWAVIVTPMSVLKLLEFKYMFHHLDK